MNVISKKLTVQSELKPASIKISLASPPPPPVAKSALVADASEPLPKLKINKRKEQEAKMKVSELETPSKRGRGRPPIKKFKESRVDALTSPKLVLKTKFLTSPVSNAAGASPEVELSDSASTKQTKGTKEDLRQLFQAIQGNSLAKVQSILMTKRIDLQKAYHSDLDNVKSQWNLIHCASFFGAVGIMRILVETFNADIEATDPMYESTALAWAAFGNQFEASQLLVLRYGARLNVKNSLGSLPLDLIPNKDATMDGNRQADEWKALLDAPISGPSGSFGHRQSLILHEIQRLTDPDDPSRHICEIFTELPHRKEYPEYYQIIDSPICLNDIEAKIKLQKSQEYSMKEFESDLRLLVRNARTFNESESQVVRDASRIEEVLSKWLTMHEAAASVTIATGSHGSASEFKAVTPKKKRPSASATGEDSDSLADEHEHGHGYELGYRNNHARQGDEDDEDEDDEDDDMPLRRKDKRGRKKKSHSGSTSMSLETKPVIVTPTGTLDMKQVRSQFAVSSHVFPSGMTIRPGDFLTLHVSEGASTDPATGAERPKIVQILSLWNHPREKERDTGRPILYFTCNAYLYPDQTIHHPTRLFYARELFKTKPKLDFPVMLLDRHVSILPVELYFRSHRPYPHIPESDVWVCEYKYSEWGKSMHRIRDWWIANRLAPPSNHVQDLVAWSVPPIPMRSLPSIYAKEVNVATGPKTLNEKSKNVLMSLQTNEQGEMIVPSILKGRRTNKALKLLGSLPPASAERLAAAALTERQRQMALLKERERMSSSPTPPPMSTSFAHGQNRVPIHFHPHAYHPQRLAPMSMPMPMPGSMPMLTSNVLDSGNGLHHLSFGPGPSASSSVSAPAPAPMPIPMHAQAQTQAAPRPMPTINTSIVSARPSSTLLSSTTLSGSIASGSSSAATSVSAPSSGPRVIPSDTGLLWSQNHGFTSVLMTLPHLVDPMVVATPPESPSPVGSVALPVTKSAPRFSKVLALKDVRSQFVALPLVQSGSTAESHRRLILVFYSESKTKEPTQEHWFFLNRQRVYPTLDSSSSHQDATHTSLVLDLKPTASVVQVLEVFQIKPSAGQSHSSSSSSSSLQARTLGSSHGIVDAKTRASIALNLFFR